MSFSTSIKLKGLAYKAESVMDYLAMAVLFTHIALAVLHSVYLLRSLMSSEAWDSVTEMPTLAHNPRPSLRALNNTPACIKRWQTYKKLVVVRADETDKETQGPSRSKGRLQLVFSEEENSCSLRSNDSDMSKGPSPSAELGTAGNNSDFELRESRSTSTAGSHDALPQNGVRPP